MADGTIGAITDRLEQAGRATSGTLTNATTSTTIGGYAIAEDNIATALRTHGEAMAAGDRDWKEFLHGSAIVLPLNVDTNNSTDSPAAFWVSGNYRKISDRTRNLDWDGSLSGVHIGFDARLGNNMLGGVALSWLESELDYAENTTDGSAADEGEYEIEIKSAHPYLSWRAGRLNGWVMAGFSEGEMNITPAGARMLVSDLSQRTAGLGGSGVLWQTPATRVRLKIEAMRAETEVEDGGDFAALEVNASRIHLTVEANHSRKLLGGGRFEPSVEFGVRHDSGDGGTGSGTEFGGALRYRNPSNRFTAEARVRALLRHSGNYEDWGIQGSLRLSPGRDEQGFSFHLSPGYGDSSVSQLWTQGLRQANKVNTTDPDYQIHLTTRIGYGIALRNAGGMLTPYAKMVLGARDEYRMGVNWKPSKMFNLTLLGEKTDQNSVRLQGEVNF